MWHRLSGLPDNVTDEGEIVEADGGRRLRSEKAQLRATIADLSTAQAPNEVRGLARLAASYLLAGDVETATRVHKPRSRDPRVGSDVKRVVVTQSCSTAGRHANYACSIHEGAHRYSTPWCLDGTGKAQSS